MHDRQFPSEPRQLRPGEDARVIGDHITIGGQVSVMAINGLLTKVIFDHNPTHEFFVEESFPLDWMYPYLTPFGIIMKVNRQTVPEFTEDIIGKDHQFWTRYSERLVGNWINYGTSIKEIVDFVEKVYLQRNFDGFKGDRKFIRDDVAQKSFSKLRTAQAGLYAYRIAIAKPGSLDQQKMIQEADFAFRQAFAFCPYSPEVVARYVPLLCSMQRIDEAILVASTCLKLDPNNGGIRATVDQLKAMKQNSTMQNQPATGAQLQAAISQLEEQVKTNPADIQATFRLAIGYLQAKEDGKAHETLDRVMAHSNVDAGTVLNVAKGYARLGDLSRLEQTLERLTRLEPDSPEAHYDLAAMKCAMGKTNEAIESLREALALSHKRLATTPGASNLAVMARTDARFSNIHLLEAFHALTASD
jgi:tetratricopeptide (TPR) repeat protein